ncbi:MAG: hypothetical protein GC155_10975 [Alphaproteobacteria bacterium]|nr:hypothetical protein [Alphaproteobacteria bacterium]
MGNPERTPRNTPAIDDIPADPNRRPQDDPKWGRQQQQAQASRRQQQMGDDPDADIPGVSHVLRDQPEPTD